MNYDQYANIWANKKSSNTHLAHKYLEKPAMMNLVEQFFETKSNTKINILDLGCGSGEDILELQKISNKYNITLNIVGVDSSEPLLEIARFNCPNTTFVNIDLNLTPNQIENLVLKFDLVYSSLTFHYIDNWQILLQSIKSVSNNNCNIIFSTHHPLKWGAMEEKNKEFNSFIMGYKKIKNTIDKSKSYFVYGDYLNPRAINTKLFNQLDITHYHKPISLMVNTILENSYKIVKMVEPKPIEIAKSVAIDFYEVQSKIPLFVIYHLISV
jgi:SAM-dependent methyltransferase